MPDSSLPCSRPSYSADATGHSSNLVVRQPDLNLSLESDTVTAEWSMPDGSSPPIGYCVQYGFTYWETEGSSFPEECVDATADSFDIDLAPGRADENRTLTGIIVKVRAKYSNDLYSPWALQILSLR